MSTSDQAIGFVLGYEGGFTNDPSDPGNWTGGAVGVGVCRGTKWGISAASYPTLDIANLTEDEARSIYLQRYWIPIAGDRLPATLALLVLDAAVNLGIGRAVRLLQSAVGTEQDGLLGPKTLSAVQTANVWAVCVEFQAQRLLFMAGLPLWHEFGTGWSRRVCRVAFDSTTMHQ